MLTTHGPIIGKQSTVKPKSRLEYLPGKLIIRIREGAVRPHLGPAALKFMSSDAKRLPEVVSGPLDYLRTKGGLTLVRPLFSRRRSEVQRSGVALADQHRLAILSSVSDSENEDLAGFAMVSVDPKQVTPRLMKQMKTSKAVELIEPMPARWLAAGGADPMQNMQWGLRAIKWFDATIPDASGVRVSVLDTGVDSTHPDLKDVSIDYHHDGLKAEDIIGHGTHVCGIIAAATNNGVGISGIAHCKVSVWKIFRDEPEEGDFYVDGERYFQALNAVIGANVKAVNLSIGGTAHSQAEALLFRRLRARGIAVAAAMGNEYQEGNPTEYPAAYDGVLAVGAVAETLRRSPFSNTGRHIGLVAPGSHILSTLPTKKSPYRDETGYAAWDGTSMATPHVTAALALVGARYRQMNGDQVKAHLGQTTTHLPAMKTAKWTQAYGSGLLNLQKALS